MRARMETMAKDLIKEKVKVQRLEAIQKSNPPQSITNFIDPRNTLKKERKNQPTIETAQIVRRRTGSRNRKTNDHEHHDTRRNTNGSDSDYKTHSNRSSSENEYRNSDLIMGDIIPAIPLRNSLNINNYIPQQHPSAPDLPPKVKAVRPSSPPMHRPQPPLPLPPTQTPHFDTLQRNQPPPQHFEQHNGHTIPHNNRPRSQTHPPPPNGYTIPHQNGHSNEQYHPSQNGYPPQNERSNEQYHPSQNGYPPQNERSNEQYHPSQNGYPPHNGHHPPPHITNEHAPPHPSMPVHDPPPPPPPPKKSTMRSSRHMSVSSVCSDNAPAAPRGNQERILIGLCLGFHFSIKISR